MTDSEYNTIHAGYIRIHSCSPLQHIALQLNAKQLRAVGYPPRTCDNLDNSRTIQLITRSHPSAIARPSGALDGSRTAEITPAATAVESSNSEQRPAWPYPLSFLHGARAFSL